MSALNRTNNRYHVAIEFESIVEGGEVGKMQKVDRSREPIFAVYLTSLFGVMSQCKGLILSLPHKWLWQIKYS